MDGPTWCPIWNDLSPDEQQAVEDWIKATNKIRECLNEAKMINHDWKVDYFRNFLRD